MVERLLGRQEVRGSIPLRSTKKVEDFGLPGRELCPPPQRKVRPLIRWLKGDVLVAF
jgi:hypothetical protein